MKPSKIQMIRVCLLTLLTVLACSSTTFAQPARPDLNSIMHDTQKLETVEHHVTLVWWMPEDFWRVSFAQNKNVTPATAERFLNLVKPYTIVVIVEAEIGAFGSGTYKDEANTRGRLSLVDQHGGTYKPIADADLNPDVRTFFETMKPLLGNMLGGMGKNMNFYAFPAKDKDNRPIASAKDEGGFSIKLGDKKYAWRLPLGSVLPPKTCTKCWEKLSGAFKFCPYDGMPLTK